MKLTILGNNGPYPSAGGACSGYLVRDGNTAVLLDCGNGVLSNLQRFMALEKLDAIVLTHLHSDHISDMMILRYAIEVRNKRGAAITPVPVYASPEPEEEFKRLDIKSAYVLSPIIPGNEIAIGSLKLSFSKLRHPFPDYGVSICNGKVKLAFTGDSSWDEAVPEFIRGADMALLDAGLLARDKKDDGAPHMTAGECGLAAAKAGVKRLMLTHFWPEYDTGDLLAEARVHFPGAEAAAMLETYEI